MSKVPVGASIAHAYEFLFGRFFQNIGTAWLPALLYGLGYYLFITAMPQTAPVHGAGGAAIGGILGLSLIAFVFFLVIRAVIAISLTQEALGVRKDLTLAHFVIGPRELRLFFGYLRFYIVFILLYIAVIALSIGAIVLAKNFGSGLLPKLALHGMPIAVLAAAILAVVLVIWFFLAMIRLSFLLAPVAATEHRMRLSRAWALTRGSALRILVVLIGTFLPAMIAVCAAAYYLIGPAEFAALVQAFHAMKPGMPPPTVAFMAHHAPMLSLIVAVEVAINGALLAGASATAYRAVTGHEDPEPEDDAALVAPLLEPEAQDDHGHHGHHEEPAPSHDDHGHGGHGHHEEPASGHGDHGHDDHGHGGHDEKHHDAAHGHDDEDGDDDDDDADGDHAAGHDDHAGDHGHGGGHDDHGHGDHGHGGHGDAHHAKAAESAA